MFIYLFLYYCVSLSLSFSLLWRGGALHVIVHVDIYSLFLIIKFATKESGAWLNVLPSPHLSTKLDDDSIRIATGLRLGANIVVRHTCVCGSIVESTGHHGLSCRRSGGRISRHQSANETICRALVSGGIPAVLEPVGIAREDGKRPDGMSLILWDFTCSDTMALSHRNQATSGPGEVACTAESFKMRKYSSLTSTYSFAPICIETMGAWGEGAKCIIKKIGRRCGGLRGSLDLQCFSSNVWPSMCREET